MGKSRKSGRRSGRSAAEYFVAAVGLALVLFVAAIVLTSDSCKLEVSPEIGVRPAQPR